MNSRTGSGLLIAALLLTGAAVPGTAATIQYKFTAQELKQAVASQSSFASGCTGTGFLQQCGIFSVTVFDPNWRNPSITAVTSPIPNGDTRWTATVSGSLGHATFRDDNVATKISFITDNSNTVGKKYSATGSVEQTGSSPMSNAAAFTFLMTAPASVSGTVTTTFWTAVSVVTLKSNGSQKSDDDVVHLMQMSISGTAVGPEVPEVGTTIMAISALGGFAFLRRRATA